VSGDGGLSTELATGTARPDHPRTAGDVVRLVLRGVGQTLITVGVVCLLFVVYSLYITNLFAAADQRALDKDIDQVFTQQQEQVATGGPTQPPLPELGDALARIYIPAIGLEKVIVEGVGVSDLKKGPGHYPGTQLPGQIGNTVISGHRTTYGHPFNALDDLNPGDAIVLESATAYYTYAMTSREIVKPSAIDVTFPVPRDASAVATIAQVTLTTCHPEYSARERMIIHGTLTSTTEKSSGQRPPALDGV
jgi:sortase A